MNREVQIDDRARGILLSLTEDALILKLPGTEYQLHLKPGGKIPASPGERISGVIEAHALRIHPARAGGRFIEPGQGEPRIVAGVILAMDQPNNRILISSVVPLWVRPLAGQDWSIFQSGEDGSRGGLVNCHVKPACTFTFSAD